MVGHKAAVRFVSGPSTLFYFFSSLLSAKWICACNSAIVDDLTYRDHGRLAGLNRRTGGCD